MAGGTQVYVLPVTHTPPSDPSLAIEIPARIKQHLGLDDERSWIVLDEINDFLWPGYDLRPVPGSRPARLDYGVLPPRYFDTVRTAFLALARARRIKRIPRGRRFPGKPNIQYSEERSTRKLLQSSALRECEFMLVL